MSNRQFKLEDIEVPIDPVVGMVYRETDPVVELKYEPIDRSYRIVHIILTVLKYIGIAVLALLLLLIDDTSWFFIAEGVIILVLALNLLVVRKAWRFKGYAIREYDISYRTGIIFPTITTIPFNRMQQVSLKQNPISKYMQLYSVEIVNGAQSMSSLTIPGLTEERAKRIKSIVVDKLRYE